MMKYAADWFLSNGRSENPFYVEPSFIINLRTQNFLVTATEILRFETEKRFGVFGDVGCKCGDSIDMIRHKSLLKERKLVELVND